MFQVPEQTKRRRAAAGFSLSPLPPLSLPSLPAPSLSPHLPPDSEPWCAARAALSPSTSNSVPTLSPSISQKTLPRRCGSRSVPTHPLNTQLSVRALTPGGNLQTHCFREMHLFVCTFPANQGEERSTLAMSFCHFSASQETKCEESSQPLKIRGTVIGGAHRSLSIHDPPSYAPSSNQQPGRIQRSSK